MLARWLHSLTETRKARARSSRPARRPLCLETLEDRALPSGGPGPSSLLSGHGGSGSSGGSGGSPGGPTPAILSTSGGSGQVVTVSGQSGGGGGGPGGG